MNKLFLSLILILYGCSTQKIADFSIVSTKNIDLGTEFQSIGIISGDDTETSIIPISIRYFIEFMNSESGI